MGWRRNKKSDSFEHRYRKAVQMMREKERRHKEAAEEDEKRRKRGEGK